MKAFVFAVFLVWIINEINSSQTLNDPSRGAAELYSVESLPSLILLPPPTKIYGNGHTYKTIWTPDETRPIKDKNNEGITNYERYEIPIALRDDFQYSQLQKSQKSTAHSFRGEEEETSNKKGSQVEPNSEYSFPTKKIELDDNFPHKKLVITLAKEPKYYERTEPTEQLYKNNGNFYNPYSNSDSSSQRPTSLAALLAASNEFQAKPETISTHSNNQTQEIKREQLVDAKRKHKGGNDSSEIGYYDNIDDLYDEFFNFYYDIVDESEDLVNSTEQHHNETRTVPFTTHTTQPPATISISLSTTTNEFQNITPEITTSRTVRSRESGISHSGNKTVTQTMTINRVDRFPNNNNSTVKEENLNTEDIKNDSNIKESQRRPGRRTKPLSLSEVLQKTGLSLPEFLTSLKKYGVSLKSVTNKLAEVSLSKRQFDLIQGDVKKLLALLNDELDKTPNSMIIDTSSTNSTSVTTFSPTSKVPLNKEILNIASEITKSNDSPVVFGSQQPRPLLKTSSLNNTNIKYDKAKLNFSKEKQIISDILTEKGVNPKEYLEKIELLFNLTLNNSKNEFANGSVDKEGPNNITLPRPYDKNTQRLRPYKPLGYDTRYNDHTNNGGIVRTRTGTTLKSFMSRKYIIPSSPPPGSKFFDNEVFSRTDHPKRIFSDTITTPSTRSRDYLHPWDKTIYPGQNKSDPDLATRSAIMAAVVLGGVALSVFIAIFIVVKYKNHMHKRKRRKTFGLPSNSSTSSIPPLYITRDNIYRASSYKSSGFWDSLKRKLDPYTVSSSPTPAEYK